MKTPLLVSFLALGLTARGQPFKPQSDFIDLGKSRLVLVRIPSGKFWMGTTEVFTAKGNWINEVERPVHQVTISKDFWMGQFPVTQRQWQEVMGDNPSYFHDAGPDAPVEQVNWNQVQPFSRS
jgi:formylglycine-generating enzyme required for sulfatase activity